MIELPMEMDPHQTILINGCFVTAVHQSKRVQMSWRLVDMY